MYLLYIYNENVSFLHPRWPYADGCQEGGPPSALWVGTFVPEAVVLEPSLIPWVEMAV